MEIQLELLGTMGCHLCEEAQYLLQPLSLSRQWSLRYIDIAETEQADAMIALYGLRIPVLRCRSGNEWRELGWPFDAEAVMQFVDAQAAR